MFSTQVSFRLSFHSPGNNGMDFYLGRKQYLFPVLLLPRSDSEHCSGRDHRRYRDQGRKHLHRFYQ